MDETTKTKRLWNAFERSILTGKGIDIGCGPDPVTEDVTRFDVEHGDANYITQYVNDDFDFVYASHCLEHMHDPRKAILEWWKLVRPGGHLFFIVPDEDLYEQGVFPSRFNADHKATFTISKQKSWSPVSVNVLDLVSALPDGRLISVMLQDQGYDRRLLKYGPLVSNRLIRRVLKLHRAVKRRSGVAAGLFDRFTDPYTVVDQTLLPDVVAQIQCIVRKEKDNR
jgi:SAM-dependent methyltransferase